VARTVAEPRGTRTAGARPTTEPAPIDGRAARGERTRRALAEALVALVEEGDLRPTARAVAARAGVSQRIVFHHFDDVEGVLREAVAVQVERHWSKLRPIDPALSTENKVTLVVRQRSALFEAISPMRRAAALAEDSSPTVAAQLARAQRGLRNALAQAFQPELDDAGAGPGRSDLLDALELCSGWETWDQLRRRMGHGPAAARRVMTRLLVAALGPHASDSKGDHS